MKRAGRILKRRGRINKCDCCDDGGCCISYEHSGEDCVPAGLYCCGRKAETVADVDLIIISGQTGPGGHRNIWRLQGSVTWETEAVVNPSGTCVFCRHDPIGGYGRLTPTASSLVLTVERGDGGCDGSIAIDFDNELLDAWISFGFGNTRPCTCAAPPRALYYMACGIMDGAYGDFGGLCPGGQAPVLQVWGPGSFYCYAPGTGLGVTPGASTGGVNGCNYALECDDVFDNTFDDFSSDADEHGGALSRQASSWDEVGGQATYLSESCIVTWSHRTLTPCGPNCELPPEGACCDGEDCSQLTEAACILAGGEFKGGPCNDIVCEPVKGACCTLDGGVGVCNETTQAECEADDGAYQGDGTQCENTDCEDVGACCNPEHGVCADEVTLADCLQSGAVWYAQLTCEEIQGAGVCIPPMTGGCCLPDKSCEGMTSGECFTAGGTWHPLTECGLIDCNVNACCLPDGSCADMTSGDCATAGGFYGGAGVDCDDIECVGGCCTTDPCGPEGGSGGVFDCVNFTTYQDCVAGGGVFGGPGALCIRPCCGILPEDGLGFGDLSE